MAVYIKFAYANPERLRHGMNEFGKQVTERIPLHPTRPARAWDYNTWAQEVDPEIAALAVKNGAIAIMDFGISNETTKYR